MPVKSVEAQTSSRWCGNRDYTGMWVRLGSTDLMAGKIMFLRSNQGGRFDGNRDYTGMWVRLGSTDLMAGKIMFLRSNQGGRFDGNESVADSFRSDLVNFKARARQFSALLLLLRLPEKPPLSGSSPVTRGQSHPSLAPSFKAK
ncbi:hypothetical protein TNCV_3710971 [Trichonephila clavipes]|uniref:Uncharacterized protein n=1 Tax=Trichonephila clavipes TaxID=2585209 RepID=A0A8X6R8W2_TRICX|nr:hypothetical protein TNCV_3710971 [Trichonephila clavipes]